MTDAVSSNATALQERLKFFFSDANFRTDKFMQNEARNNDGYIEITSLLKFNSVSKLTSEVKDVAEAAKNVPTVVLSKDGEAIRRKEPVPEDYNPNKRTVVVTGIPTEDIVKEDKEAEAQKVVEEEKVEEEKVEEVKTDEEKTTESPRKEKKVARASQEYKVSISDISTAFSKYGEVALVRMRYSKSDPARKLSKSAQGSCFVEFGSEEAAKKAAESKEKVTVGGVECEFVLIDEVSSEGAFEMRRRVVLVPPYVKLMPILL